MDTNKVLADFQFLDNKVVKFHIENNSPNTRNKTVKINYDMDYEIISCDELEDIHLGVVDLIVDLTGKIDDNEIFKIHLRMKGKFVGSKNKLTLSKFREMLEVNGTATLSQISRAYLISASTLSGMVSINLPMVNIYAMKKYKKELSDEKLHQDIVD